MSGGSTANPLRERMPLVIATDLSDTFYDVPKEYASNSIVILRRNSTAGKHYGCCTVRYSGSMASSWESDWQPAPSVPEASSAARGPLATHTYTFLEAGSAAMKLYETTDGRVMLEGETFLTDAHGFLHAWTENPPSITVCCSKLPNPTFGSVRTHQFQKVSQGIYVSPDGMLLLDDENMDRKIMTSALSMYGRTLPLRADPQVNDIEHMFLWMHPKQGARIVYVLNNTCSCLWRALTFDDEVFSDTHGTPNVVFAYDKTHHKPYFCSNWHSDAALTRPVRFKPLPAHPRWYRSEGDGRKILDPDNLKAIAEWHIVVYQFY